MNALTQYQVHQDCLQIQAEFPVHELQLDGVHFWPAVRFFFYTLISDARQQRYMAYFQSKSHSTVFGKGPATPSSHARQAGLRAFERSLLLAEHPESARWLEGEKPDFLLYELFVDYRNERPEGLLDKYLDPFIRVYGKDYRFAKLCRIEEAARNRAYLYPPLFFDYLVDETQWLPPATGEREFLRALRTLNRYLEKAKPHLSVDPVFMLARCLAILARAAELQQYLEYFSPRAVFFQSYPNVFKMPLALACRRHGIPAVDVQHGYLDTSQMFGDWQCAPKEGYALLPEVLWTWGAPTARAWESAFPPECQGHRAVIGGYLWEDCKEWKPRVAEQSAGHRDFLRASTKLGKRRWSRRILVAHQPDLLVQGEAGDILPRHLIEAMAASPKDWQWLLRLHPRSLHLIEHFREAVADALAPEQLNVQEASTLDLDLLLPECSHLLTSWSTVAFEAQAAGIPVGLLDQTGAAIFRGSVGEAFPALLDQRSLSNFIKKERHAQSAEKYFHKTWRRPELSTLLSGAPR